MSNQRYQIKQQIRQGRTGGVYEAYDTTLKRSVTLRRFYSHQTGSCSQSQLTRFEQSAQRFSSFQHPNILTVLETGADQHGPHIISEMEDGILLADYIEKHGPLDEYQTYQLAQQLTDALLAAHQNGVTHGALSSRSVVINSNGLRGPSFKLVDLGLNVINSIFDQDSPVSDLADPSIMAPELFDGHQPNVLTDIFTAGQLCYLAIAGGHPNVEQTPAAMQKFYIDNHSTRQKIHGV